MKFAYLTIEGYSDAQFDSKVGEYEVMINPETFTHSYTVNYSDRQEPGTANVSSKYEKAPPSELTFDLIFDGSGVVDKNKTNILKEIETFRKLVYDYNGDIHKSNYLKIMWGSNPAFQCHLTSLSITYKLFRPDGTPIRAEAKASFKNFEDPKMIAAKEDSKSPDMTHLVTVVAGDTLPALCYKIYGQRDQYMKVARFNNLINFRNLKPGTRISFPPLV